MADSSEDIVAAGAEIIWVLEQSATLQPGTADNCVTTMETLGATVGWCVGDSETKPESGAFDASPFSVARGFDMIVDRATMQVEWTSSHGTPTGNENLTGAEVLAEVEARVGR